MLARAPKNCICLPTSIGDTQQAIAPSSPQARRMMSSLSNWMELVSMATLAAKRRKASGRRGEYQIGQVRFRRGTEIVESLKKAKARLGHERPAVVAHASNRFRHPGRVAREQFVVFRAAQEADNAQFDHEVVDDLLCLLLSECARGEIPLQSRCPGRSRCARAT